MDHSFTFNTHSVNDRNDTNIPADTNDTNIPGDTNDTNTPGDTNDTNILNDTENASQCGGVLGIYRITLWIIIMTSTIFSMIMQYH